MKKSPTFDVQDALDTLTKIRQSIPHAAVAGRRRSRRRAHADLIPHVEAMRRAYELSYGTPLPPRP